MSWRRNSLFLVSRLPPLRRLPPEHLGVTHAIGCSSGTDALWLALAAAGIGPGDAVVTTPFSFFASVSAILRAGARPVLADIDPATFNLDPDAVEASWKARRAKPFRAILPVHLYGQCADWTGFRGLAKEHGLKLIEDAAQAWARRGGREAPAGSATPPPSASTPPRISAPPATPAWSRPIRDEMAERARMLAPAWHAPPLLPRRGRLETRHGRLPGRDSPGEAEVHRRLEPCAPHDREALRRAVSRRRSGRVRTLSGATASCCRTKFPAPPRLAPVCDSHAHAATRCATFSARARSARRFTTRCRCTCRRRSRISATTKAISLKPNALRAKCWRCPSSPSCAKTSSRPWSMRSLSF